MTTAAASPGRQQRALARGRAAAGQPALPAVRLACADSRCSPCVVYHVFVLTARWTGAWIGDAGVRLAGSLGPRSSSRSRASCSTGLGRGGSAGEPAAQPAPLSAPAERSRILPAYWFALTVLAIYPGHRRALHRRLVALLLLPAGLRRPRRSSTASPVAWTLCVEVTFYLVAAAVGRPRRAGRDGAQLAGAGRCWRVAGAASRSAAGRGVIDLAAASLLGQVDVVRRRHGARRGERRVRRPPRVLRARIGDVAARRGAGPAPWPRSLALMRGAPHPGGLSACPRAADQRSPT